MICGYLGCSDPATHEVVPPYGQAWIRCQVHMPLAAAALKDSTVRVLQ